MNQSSNEVIKLFPNSFSKKNRIFFNTCFDKGHVKELVSWFLKKYGEKQTINFLETLKYTGFNQATRAGISLGIEDLEIPPEKPNLITAAQITTHKIEQKSASGSLTSVEKSQYLIDTWNQTSDLLRQNAIQNFRARNVVNPVYMMAFSGARGNVSQVRQLVAMRGLMADPQGAILEFPIQSNFREGLTITEYLISCYGARKGLVDTALRTATSGYLTRRLVDSAQHAVVSIINCGTTRHIIVEGKNLESRLIGRVLAKSLENKKHLSFIANQIISPNNAKIIAKNHTQVLIRSPLTCEATTSVCQFCYGWNLASGKLVQIGEAVGVIAAQSIGEPGTQLTMRTFHTGGVGVFTDQALKPIISPYEGKIIFSEPIPGHFVRTPHGKIVYMVKYIPTDPNKILLKIKSSGKIDREFLMREEDIPPGSLLFIKHGENIHTKQLIAQASLLKLTKQKLPESSHPVYSPLQGQVFFESMNLSIEKEVFNSLDDLKKSSEQEKYFLSLNSSSLPDTRRMAKIGSFWVLSGYNQHEFHRNNASFLESGDLVSKNTILYNYLFHSPIQNQLYKLNENLAFGVNSIEIPIKKTIFKDKIYKFYISNLDSDVLIYKKQNKKISSLVWYPFRSVLKHPYLKQFLYSHISPLYLTFFSNEKITNRFLKQPVKGNIFGVKQKFNKNLKKYNTTKPPKKLIKKVFSNTIKNCSNKTLLSNLTSKSFSNSKVIYNLSNFKNNFNFVDQIKTIGWVVTIEFSYLNLEPGRQFLSSGNTINNICFPKYNISVKSLSLKNDLKTLSFYKRKKSKSRNWYTSSDFIDKNFLTKSTDSKLRSLSNSKTSLINELIWYQVQKNSYNIEKSNEKYITLKKLLIIQSTNEYTFPSKKYFQQKLAKFSSQLVPFNTNNLLFSKQGISSRNLKYTYPFEFKAYNPTQSGYFSLKNLMRVEFHMKKNLDYPNIYFQYQFLPKTCNRALTVFQYSISTFKDPQNFSFQTYQNNWIIPTQPFSIGNVKVQTIGEFRYQSKKTIGTFLSIIRPFDTLTFSLHADKKLKIARIGDVIRWGDEIFSNVACEHNGQILKKTRKNITIRLGVPILASARGIVHVFQNDLVEKNQLLITLKSRRLQTEDIVQGIPKIEQLFEARESQGGEILSDTVHIRLRNAFVRELQLLQSEHWSLAVEKSFTEAQQFLVQNIVDAYGNQGVKISEKHVEVIVRQMTSRVRILEAGETGLLPGELVQHIWIQKFNKQIREIGLREATYEPIVLGISKSVLQSESFLLAASFQEVSRVLVRSALSKKRDFLKGLHENVIVGQLIPGGTGLFTQMNRGNNILLNSPERRV